MHYVLPKPDDGTIFHNYLAKENYWGRKLSHEYLFLKYLQIEIAKNPNLVTSLYIYILQCHPNYTWAMPWVMANYIISRYSTETSALRDDIITEIEYHIHRFERHQKVGDIKEKEFNDSMHFGEIATEFLIRYKNYSLIGFCDKPIILTAQDNCEKKFEEYIQRGYCIFRLSKLYYENEGFYELYCEDEVFCKLPVLPSKEDWVDEVIEAPDGSYVQMSKYASSDPIYK